MNAAAAAVMIALLKNNDSARDVAMLPHRTATEEHSDAESSETFSHMLAQLQSKQTGATGTDRQPHRGAITSRSAPLPTDVSASSLPTEEAESEQNPTVPAEQATAEVATSPPNAAPSTAADPAETITAVAVTAKITPSTSERALGSKQSAQLTATSLGKYQRKHLDSKGPQAKQALTALQDSNSDAPPALAVAPMATTATHQRSREKTDRSGDTVAGSSNPAWIDVSKGGHKVAHPTDSASMNPVGDSVPAQEQASATASNNTQHDIGSPRVEANETSTAKVLNASHEVLSAPVPSSSPVSGASLAQHATAVRLPTAGETTKPSMYSSSDLQIEHYDSSAANRLEVGLSNGSSGWLRVRAELSEDGGVHATLRGSSSAIESSLRSHMSELSSYLATQQVPVQRLELETSGGGAATWSSAASDQGQRGSESRQENGSRNSQPVRSSASASGTESRSETDAQSQSAPAYVSGSGTWLSVRV